MSDPPLQGRFRATSLSAAALRQNEAFATNFHAAGVGTGPSEVAVRRRSSVALPMLKEMTPAEVEQITGRLAEVKRSCHDFGETPVEVVVHKPVLKPRRSSDSNDADPRARRVRKQFEEIDAGRLDPDKVFSTISGADNRVKLKLNYFRDRSDLVLPIIEDRYVTHDAQRDCFVLDLPLLQNNNTGSLSARTPRKQGQILVGKSEEDDLDSPCSRGLSLEPSRQIDSQTRPSERSSRSIETSEEKSLRLMRAARIRDERISIAQHNARCAEFEWRLNHFETCRRKDRRKQQASAQRILLSWLTLAYVSKQWQDAMLRDRWQRAARSHNFGDHYANRSKAHWQRAKNLVHKSVSESRNMHDFRRVLQIRTTRSKAAWQRWDHLFVILKFLTRLMVRRKFNRAADAVKQFIESSWRGMHFRSKVGVYLTNVRLLQRSIRAAHRFRINCKLYIYAPYLWELETQLLGEKLKAHLPKNYTKQKIQQHRQAWDFDGRVRALQEMMKERQLKGLKGPMSEKKRQTLVVKAKAKPERERRRRGATRIGMYNERQVIFTDLGEAVHAGAGMPDRKQQQAWNVANHVLDHYRLDLESRRNVVRLSYQQALDRWKNSHHAWQKQQHRLNILWQQWRLEIQALGKAQQEHWPPPPPHIEPPAELFKVDTKKMTSLIIAGLAQTALGRSLFARDIRDMRVGSMTAA